MEESDVSAIAKASTRKVNKKHSPVQSSRSLNWEKHFHAYQSIREEEATGKGNLESRIALDSIR
jgi:hypothetical protein